MWGKIATDHERVGARAGRKGDQGIIEGEVAVQIGCKGQSHWPPLASWDWVRINRYFIIARRSPFLGFWQKNVWFIPVCFIDPIRKAKGGIIYPFS
ncbi:MAG: hypothetical protein OHK0050_05420 [Roseiflexaceae bacterium]